MNWTAIRNRATAWALAALPWLVSLLVLAVLCHRFNILTVCKVWAEQKQDLPDPRLWLLVPTAGMVAVVLQWFQGWRSRALATVAAVLLAAVLPLLPVGILYLSLFVPVAALAHAAFRRYRDAAPWDTPLIASACLVLVLAVAARIRTLALLSLLPRPLDPDAMGYLQFANERVGYDTEYREPAFIWLLQLLKNFSGGDYSHPAGRLYGLFLGLAAITLVFEFVRRFFGLVPAIVAGLLYSMGTELLFLSVRALREDVIVATFFLFAGAYLKTWGAPPTLRAYLLLGLAAAPGILLRLNTNLFVTAAVLIHFAGAAWKHRPHPRAYALPLIAIAAAILPLTPYLVYCQMKYKDAFYRTGLEARYFANIELAGKHPEIPTREQFEQENYTGGPMKMSTYLFRYHTVGQLVSGAWDGAVRLLGGDLAEHAYRSVHTRTQEKSKLLWLHFLGLFAYLLAPRRLVLLGLLGLFHAPSLYLVQFRWFDPRLVTVAFVGFYVGCGLAVATLIEWGARLMRATAPTDVKSQDLQSAGVKLKGGKKRHPRDR